MTRRTFIQIIVPTVGLAIGFTAVAIAEQSQASVIVNSQPNETASTASSSSPNPEATPLVTVNGRRVEAKSGASINIPVPGGTATVERSGTETKVRTDLGNTNITSITGVGDVSVNVNSTKASGTTFSSSNIYSTSSSTGGSDSTTNTTVRSTGTDNVQVTE